MYLAFMNKVAWFTVILASFGLVACAQNNQIESPVSDQTLLWRISGNNLSQPSYLFGTMHMLCADDIELSDSLKSAIKRADNVYLELEMDNIFEMFGVMDKMAMKNDTTLEELLTEKEYEVVKSYFRDNSSMIPFSMLKTYKPLLSASMLAEKEFFDCDNMIAMEQLIMKEAKTANVKIKGLETMQFQLELFDKIPYKLQAQQLYEMISQLGQPGDEKDVAEMTNAYRNQQLNKMEEITLREDMGIKNFADILLYERNAAWAEKLKGLLPGKSLVIAVGAGHLPGEKGVIKLLQKKGYKVEPVRNDMIKKKTREI